LREPEELKTLKQQLEQVSGRPVLTISAAASQGLDILLAAVWQELGIQSS
jgi:predicted GTPase